MNGVDGSAGTPRLPGLDGLRGLACLLVFAVHFGQISGLQGHWGPFDAARALQNGNTGVALFFVLSGFLLSRPYWRARAAGQALPPARRFFVRRAARILPAYLVALAAIVIANRYWEEEGAAADIVLHVLLVFNVVEATTLSINPPFWTVAVESQFYLLLPLLFVLLRGSSRRRAVAVLLGAGVLAWIGYAALSIAAGRPLASLSYSLLAHLPHFLLGVVTAALAGHDHAGPAPAPRARNDLALLATVALLVAILSTPLDDWLQLPFGRYNLPTVPLLLCVLVALVPRSRLGRRVFGSLPLRGIGLVSYGVYLVHLPVLHVSARLLGRASIDVNQHWALFGAISLAASLVIASLSYLLLERPVQRAVR